MIGGFHKIDSTQATSWVRALLEAVGVPETFSLSVADVFVRAQSRDVGHHDLSYLPQRLDWLERRQIKADPLFVPIRRSNAVEVWDADCGLGELATTHIVDRAIELARSYGLGYCAIRRSNHFLAAAPHVERAAERGFFALVWSNTDAGMSFPGGRTRQIGNNPLGFSVPCGETGEPWSVDLSLAYSSLGNLKSTQEKGESVPSWWGVDERGRSTNDPRALESGGIRPIGEHKGFSLALLGEVLTGIFADGATIDQIEGAGGLNTHSQMAIVLNLESLGGTSSVSRRIEDMIERVHASDPSVRVPGERSSRSAVQNRSAGLRVSKTTVDELIERSKVLGVEVPGFERD